MGHGQLVIILTSVYVLESKTLDDLAASMYVNASKYWSSLRVRWGRLLWQHEEELKTRTTQSS